MIRRSSRSRSSAATIDALMATDRATMSSRTSGSRARSAAVFFSMSARSSGSRLSPYLATSARPEMY
jgi:hypothetical protein